MRRGPGTARSWSVLTVLVAATVGGCGGPVDEGTFTGEYGFAGSGAGSVLLEGDGTFTATAVPAEALVESADGEVDMSGTWEYLDSAGFLYLDIDDATPELDGLGASVQVYRGRGDTLFLAPNPDRPGFDLERRG